MAVPAREQDHHRKIIAPLAVACLLSERPGHLPPFRRPKGLKGAGHTYERHVGRFLEREGHEVCSGQWFRFRDANGFGCCQTDHYVVFPDQILLFECKLTETWVGFSQIDFLYRPILERIYSLPVTGVLACKHLTTRSNPRLISDYSNALSRPGANFVWHYLP